jgi:hypothetical protein
MRFLSATHRAAKELLHNITMTHAAGLFGHQWVKGKRFGIPVVPNDQFIIGIVSHALSGYDFREQRISSVRTPAFEGWPGIRSFTIDNASAHRFPGPVLYCQNSEKSLMGGFLVQCLRVAQVAVRARCRHACLRRNLTGGHTKMRVSQSQHFLMITMTFDASLPGRCPTGEDKKDDARENDQPPDIHGLSTTN